MAEFETLEHDEHEFGNRNFIEVARKQVVTDDETTEFVSVARGFYSQDDDNKHYKANVTFPPGSDVAEFITNTLEQVTSDNE